MVTTTEEAVRDLVQLTKCKRDLQAELKQVQDDLNDLEQKIVADWTSSGTKSVRLDVGLVYLSRDLSISTGWNTRLVAEAMQQMDLPDFVTVNHQRLKSWIKERITDTQTGEWETHNKSKLDKIADLVTLSEVYSLGVRA